MTGRIDAVEAMCVIDSGQKRLEKPPITESLRPNSAEVSRGLCWRAGRMPVESGCWKRPIRSNKGVVGGSPSVSRGYREMESKMRNDALHAKGLACSLTLTVLLAFVFLNLDGYQLHLTAYFGTPEGWYGPGDIQGEPPTSNWVHGWPVGCAMRLCIRPPKAPIRSMQDLEITSRWPFDGTPVLYSSPFAAAVNVLVCLLLLFGTYKGSSALLSKLGWRLTFGLRTVLITVLVAALLVRFRGWAFASRYSLEGLAVLAIVLGGVCFIYWIGNSLVTQLVKTLRKLVVSALRLRRNNVVNRPKDGRVQSHPQHLYAKRMARRLNPHYIHSIISREQITGLAVVYLTGEQFEVSKQEGDNWSTQTF